MDYQYLLKYVYYNTLSGYIIGKYNFCLKKRLAFSVNLNITAYKYSFGNHFLKVVKQDKCVLLCGYLQGVLV